MKDIQFFAKVSAAVPIVFTGSFLLAILAGILKAGHLPQPYIDPDPDGMNSIILYFFLIVHFICFFISLIAIPGWILLTVYLFVNRIAFTKKDISLHLTAILCIGIYLLFFVVWRSPLEWLYD
ncbi:MAG: hypothetical protein IPP72_19520 [Chitinophagaceae bacterium]|nr:hypothetical protein [Chitinophagaceae bacterium]